MDTGEISSLSPGGHEVREHEQILHTKSRPPASDAEVRISEYHVRPAHRHRAEEALGVFEGHPLLAPQLLGDDEPERSPVQRVKGMSDQNLLAISRIACI